MPIHGDYCTLDTLAMLCVRGAAHDFTTSFPEQLGWNAGALLAQRPAAPAGGADTGGRGRHHHGLVHGAHAASPELHKTLLLDLPRRMRDELGMRVIDLMTAHVALV